MEPKTDMIPLHDEGWLHRGQIARSAVRQLLPLPDLYGLSKEVRGEMAKLVRQGKIIRYDDYTFPKMKPGYALRDPNLTIEEQQKKEAIRSLEKGSWKAVPYLVEWTKARIEGKFEPILDKSKAMAIAEREQASRTPQARAADSARRAKQVVPVQCVHLWRKKPRRLDIEHIDTPAKRKQVVLQRRVRAVRKSRSSPTLSAAR